ncbi:putative zinc/iron permease [Helianthus annuus]|uniref:Putative zinc transporter 11 n=1 Tax=Helianthus annuus TaxID=4232 RepID=A0A251T9C9_HELAN|nr:zinc transporter 11 [Helianthus annuus]KAF5781160.1 putative zinc/iron permease [Helianthus annuus]KAJ0500827.1 putative zinc/iron permease [Helianthus annuus]KAJ0516699.1 putative zinc/iron permease [Helianthus annuus]KAJ0684702.1 putative zinc/iron permease [Helianthus annuus]KAJ0688645.1 putative zinc/iron permease [Helianthus annuus]
MFRNLFFTSLLLVLILSAAAHGGDDNDDDADAAADTPKPDLRSRSLILVKIWCLIIIFFATFIGGVSPYFLKWNEGLLVLGTQFAGGVFLGTAMMHFLSDANETFEDLTSVEYPFAFMLACGGYLLTMFADNVISYVYGKQSGDDVEDQGETRNGKDGITHPKIGISSVSSLGDSVLLIVALCFHSVFEGIAIGIADSKADAWKALWTISLHKIFAAIAMGIALLRMIPDRPLLSCASYAFAFGISSPVGVAIGIVIDATTQGRVADWIFAISMGIACGVFIYVSINHLLRGYQAQKPAAVDTPHYKFLAVTLGLGVIAVVMIWDT